MWNVRRGKIFPVTAPTAAKRLLPQEYFVRAAANGFNTEEMGHEMTRQQMEQIRMESMKQYGFGPETMKQLKVCANCGAIVPADLHRRCPVCETVLSDNAIFCPQCGTMLTAKRK